MDWAMIERVRWEWDNKRATRGEERRNSIRWNKINGWMLRLHFEAPETITYAHGFALFKKRELWEWNSKKKKICFHIQNGNKKEDQLKTKINNSFQGKRVQEREWEEDGTADKCHALKERQCWQAIKWVNISCVFNL